MVYCVLLWFASIIIPGGFITWITFSWNGFPMQFLGTNLKMNCNNWTVLHLKQLSGLVISRIGEEQQHVNQTMFHSVSQIQWYLDKSKTFVTFVWTNPTHARHVPMHTLITHPSIWLCTCFVVICFFLWSDHSYILIYLYLSGLFDLHCDNRIVPLAMDQTWTILEKDNKIHKCVNHVYILLYTSMIMDRFLQ